MNTTLTIQQAAKASELSIHTLRYYERMTQSLQQPTAGVSESRLSTLSEVTANE